VAEEHFGADTFRGLRDADAREIEKALGIECRVCGLQEQAALRDGADAAPFAGGGFKDACDGGLSDTRGT
jgi:hypothetical protein